jgi:hypothetical protein
MAFGFTVPRTADPDVEFCPDTVVNSLPHN